MRNLLIKMQKTRVDMSLNQQNKILQVLFEDFTHSRELLYQQ